MSSNNKPSWATQTQTTPPDFGLAKLVPSWWLNWAVRRRKDKSRVIISSAAEICDFEIGKISIVILSCKRLPELKRLVKGLDSFIRNIEAYSKVEKILVDNGSGYELVEWAEKSNFFDRIIAHKSNLGMAVALDDAYIKANGEYILLLEEDFIVEYDRPFFKKCLTLFHEYPEIGIIRLKNQRNWGKSYRIISPLRNTSDGTEFWTWLPSLNGKLNVWAAGSVMFRKVSFVETGRIPIGPNVRRNNPKHQGVLYEETFGKKYNKRWLAAKIKDCYPFVQPNDNSASPGWGEVTDMNK